MVEALGHDSDHADNHSGTAVLRRDHLQTQRNRLNMYTVLSYQIRGSCVHNLSHGGSAAQSTPAGRTLWCGRGKMEGTVSFWGSL